MCCTKCHPHNQKSYGVRIANIKMKTGEGCLLDGCRAWTCELVATGIAEAQREVNRMDDLISRQAAIEAMNTRLEDIKLTWRGKVKKGEIAMYLDMRGVIETLPSAQPEHRFDEWCTDCKEYDHERHCCPRFNQVIRTTLQEVQEKQKKEENDE